MQAEHPLALDSFLEEVKDLSRVDWPDLWEGPPAAGYPGFEEWCSRYGWEPRTAERELTVITRHGNQITLASNGNWSPVNAVRFDYSPAEVRTSEADEKRAVVDRGIAEWKRFGKLVSNVWGKPTWAGCAGDDDFPESPVAGPWKTPKSPSDNPFRVTLWSPPQGCGGPVVLLTLGVPRFTWEANSRAAALLSVSFHPPASGGTRG